MTSDLPFNGRRYLLDGGGPMHGRATPQLDMCHHFFRQLYTSVSEVLPTYTTNGVGHSSEHEYDELTGWTHHRLVTDIVADTLDDLGARHLSVRKLPIWYMADLY